MKITRLDAPRCLVGEGPVWDVEEQALYYVDIMGKAVHRLDHATGATTSWEVPGTVGSLAVRSQGGLLLALADGFYTLDTHTGKVTPLLKPDALDPRVQFNDGKVDRRGRFVVGTTDSKAQEPLGAIYSVTGKPACRQIDEGITISNGPCWSPDNRTFYFADSLRSQVYAYDYDIDSGDVANRRVFANTQELELGPIPDGATVDTDGLVWMAICEGAKVVAFRPDGKVERTVDFPVSLTASVMFGGPALDLLFVTSIDPLALKALGLDKPAEEEGGCLFVVEGLGARGIAEPRFAG
jgi:sugar lactone lactonase YvrE